MFRPTHTLFAALAVALGAAPAQGQVSFTKELDQLEAATLSLANSSTDFPAALRDAARLHERIIEIRGPDDPGRAQSMIQQAALFSAIGDVNGARAYLGRAVADGMRTGDMLGAADASATAAVLAQQAGDFRSERIFRKNARSIALSPELTQEQSAAIVARLYGENWKANGSTALID